MRIFKKVRTFKTLEHFEAFEDAQSVAWWKLYGMLLVCAAMLVWFSQHSIQAYWQQTYHRESPMSAWEDMAWWRAGAALHATLDAPISEVHAQFSEHNEVWKSMDVVGTVAPMLTSSEGTQSALASGVLTVSTDANMLQQFEAFTPPPPTDLNMIALASGDQVLFAGDSLMQGVAPFVQQRLKKSKIDSINLSKHSTGLSYPNLFDWPMTIEQTLQKHKEIKVLVVFLGANDPWNFADPNKPKGSYLRFKTPAWDAVYQQRIGRILTAAAKSNVRVIWLGIPFMRDKQLNEHVMHLNTLYEASLSGRGMWLPTEKLLSGDQQGYRDALMLDGKLRKVRGKDGVHFSRYGQQLLADYILSHLQLEQ